MKECRGLLNYSDKWELPIVKIFTGNSTIRGDGALVMGRGAALQVRDAYPGIDKKMGNQIRDFSKSHNNSEYYGICFATIDDPSPICKTNNKYGSKFDDSYNRTIIEVPKPKQIIGSFQVKTHYSNHAEDKIIRRSADILNRVALAKPHIQFHMNFPGIGYGNLKYKKVLKIVEILPDNVILYR